MPKKNIGNKAKTENKAQKVILAIGIAIIFAFFVNLGIQVFYPSPEWNDYCQDYYRYPPTEEDCNSKNGTWISYENQNESPNTKIPEKGYCDFNKQEQECSTRYENVNEKHSKIVFIITLVIGILVIIGSLFISVTSVSSGLMAGGIIVIITGLMQYWRYSDDVLRFSILGLILAILIWIGYKKLK